MHDMYVNLYSCHVTCSENESWMQQVNHRRRKFTSTMVWKFCVIDVHCAVWTKTYCWNYMYDITSILLSGSRKCATAGSVCADILRAARVYKQAFTSVRCVVRRGRGVITRPWAGGTGSPKNPGWRPVGAWEWMTGQSTAVLPVTDSSVKEVNYIWFFSELTPWYFVQYM